MLYLDGGSNINQEQLINNNNSDTQSKFWIHKFDKDLLRQLNATKILGAEKKRSIILKNIKPNDKILLFSTLDIDKKKKIISFIAYTMVDEIFEDNEILYNHYHSPKKIET